jgi:hypothetical protein
MTPEQAEGREIELSTLLCKCENNERKSMNIFLHLFNRTFAGANLELTSVEHMGHTTATGAITIQLNTVDSALFSAITTSNARQDIDHSEIVKATGLAPSTPRQTIDAAYNVGPKSSNFLQPLQSVISKLDIFVQIMDKISKVNLSMLDTVNIP